MSRALAGGLGRSWCALALVLAGACASGCAQNAIFELTLDLPPRPATLPAETPMYAFPQMRATAEAYTDRWAGQDPLTGVALTAERTTMQISVIGDSDIETAPLRFKTQFCVDARCTGFGDDRGVPIQCVEFTRVFYVGKVTSFTHRIGTVPPAPADPLLPCPPAEVIAIDRCLIHGCRDGDTANYCRLEDGTHFCE